MMPLWSLAADVLLSLLLIGMIATAVRLDSALRVIRRDRGVFEALIVNLSTATESVQAGIQALRTEADRAAGHIGQSSQDADKMATDLSFLIDAADRAGARLEERLRSVQPGDVVPVRESKSVRIARKLRAGASVPGSLKAAAAVETAAYSLPQADEATPPPGQASRSGSLFQQAGITTRRRFPDATETPGTSDGTGVSTTLPAANSTKKTG